jgi:hypothetical protein
VEPDSDSRIPLRQLSRGRKRALIIAARVEFAVATLVALGICTARLTIFSQDPGPPWAGLAAVVTPAYLMACGLLATHAYTVRRPVQSLAPELAFWLVAPLATLALLLITSP